MPIILTPYQETALPPIRGKGSTRGLSVSTVLPSELVAVVEDHYGALAAELSPPSHVAGLIVRQLARHGAALDLAAATEASALRLGEATATAFSHGEPSEDARRVAAMSSDVLERVSRYRASHERGLYAAARLLTSFSKTPRLPPHLPQFASEDTCTQYLVRWQSRQVWCCPSCGASTRYWLRSRSGFECVCRKHYSLRHGTVFHGSHVPLMAWFSVVAHVVIDPSVTAAVLADKVTIVRRATIRKMINRVHDALAAPNPGPLLADVDAVVVSSLR